MTELTHSRLLELLHYDAETDLFTRLVSCGAAKTGSVAGSPQCGKYLSIMIDGKNYLSHRLAWFYIYETMPNGILDHKNNNPLDNRIKNLRQATKQQNNRNQGVMRHNASGHKGVCWASREQKWKASASVDNKHKHLGYFDSPELANDAYLAFAKINHGDFFYRGLQS